MIRLVFVVVALCLYAAPVRAQDAMTVLPPNFVLNDILNRQRVEAAIGQPLDGPKTPAKPAPKPAQKPAGTTRYTASTQVSRQVTAQFVAMIRDRVGAAEAAQVETVLTSNDAVANWAGIVGSDGLKPGDLADAFAGYWVLNWVMANGGENTRTQTLAVRDQVRPILAGMGSLSDARKQELAETFILNFLMQHAAYIDAARRGDRAMMQKLGDTARTRFQTEMGVDLRALKLTDVGFRPV